MTRIRMTDLGWQFEQIRRRVEPAITRLLMGGAYIEGEDVAEFEVAFAAYHGVLPACCVACANGSDALYLALLALGVGRSDTVVTVPNTFVATAHAIERTGAQAIFVDVDPELHTMRPELLADAIRPSTRAILPVHLYGHPADMGPILEVARSRDLDVVEDCAQACGAEWQGRRVGTIGSAGAFSFFPTKPLGCAGDGGAVIFRDENLAAEARGIAHQGFAKEKNLATRVGINSRLDALQAIILREKLRLLDEWNEHRRALAKVYENELGRLPGPFIRAPRESAWAKHVYHQYTVQYDGAGDPAARRSSLRDFLREKGIDTMVYYPHLVTDQWPYVERITKKLPSANGLVERVLSLPIHAGMDRLSVVKVCEQIYEWGK